MLGAEVLLGASLMGMLPLCTQQLVYAAEPASENFSCGFLQVICMVVAAVLSAYGPVIGGVHSAASVLALTALEVLAFFLLERRRSKDCPVTGGDAEGQPFTALTRSEPA